MKIHTGLCLNNNHRNHNSNNDNDNDDIYIYNTMCEIMSNGDERTDQ